MIEILKKIGTLAVAPVSPDADKQNDILCRELPFKVLRYKTGREHNGWQIPHSFQVINAEIKKDGKLIYDGTKHPLGVVGYSGSFKGKVSLSELQKHLFYKKEAPDRLVYHCDYYYKPYKENWGFSMPFNLYRNLQAGEYEVDLQTKYIPGYMQVLDYTHKGKSSETIVLNAHNCHAAQLNDGPSGYVVLIEAMKRLRNRKTRYTYKLIIAPEHLGTVFYLADMPKKELMTLKYGIFMEMVGHDNHKFALQKSFTGESLIDKIAEHVLNWKSRAYWTDSFRKIVGNDETVWEAPGIEVPMISLSRCQPDHYYYPEYHTDGDSIKIMNERNLEETVKIVGSMIDIFEENCLIERQFTGLVALSNPKYDLYVEPGTDPSSKNADQTAIRSKWNYLMDCLPRYFNKNISVLDIAIRHELPFGDVYDYLLKFKEKNLITLIFKK